MSRSQSGTVAIHPYIGDGTADHNGNDRCKTCLLPKTNRSHRLPERTAEQRALEERRTGDR